MRRETILLLNVVIGLVLTGLLMVYSTSAARAFIESGAAAAPYGMFKRQLMYSLVGVLALIFAAKFDYHHLRSRPILWTLSAITIFMLVAVLALSDARRGGTRWIEILGYTFQPSELAKVVVVILLAVKLSENQEHTTSFWRGFVPPLIITSVFIGLVLLERDLGGPVIMASVALLMIVMAGGRWSHVIPTCVPVATGVAFLISTSQYRSDRIDAWLDPWKYRSADGLQLIESLAGIARGGLWGLGLGAGQQKLNYLPDAHSDFIFSNWAEEMGLVGAVGLLLMYALLLILGIRIAVCARDLFGSLLASGIVALILVQTSFNLAVVTGLLPTKGLALPFISAGGSALIMNLAMIGILINVGAQAEEPEEEPRLVTA